MDWSDGHRQRPRHPHPVLITRVFAASTDAKIGDAVDLRRRLTPGASLAPSRRFATRRRNSLRRFTGEISAENSFRRRNRRHPQRWSAMREEEEEGGRIKAGVTVDLDNSHVHVSGWRKLSCLFSCGHLTIRGFVSPYPLVHPSVGPSVLRFMVIESKSGKN